MKLELARLAGTFTTAPKQRWANPIWICRSVGDVVRTVTSRGLPKWLHGFSFSHISG